MKTLVPLLLLALAAGCNRFESPTDPMRAPGGALAGAAEVEPLPADDDPYFAQLPAVTVAPGESRQLLIRTKQQLPIGGGFTLGDWSVASVSGAISSGGAGGTVTITGVREGSTRLYAVLWNMGRASGVRRFICDVHVQSAQSRRRSVQH